ncbi:hypothetical protein BMS3Bbin04_00911 [bacterium BMS3Bbin04]|nr:hypothetical protein BMS3Bbin04_00911 [bacterium BMS3Bbin04]
MRPVKHLIQSFRQTNDVWLFDQMTVRAIYLKYFKIILSDKRSPVQLRIASGFLGLIAGT